MSWENEFRSAVSISSSDYEAMLIVVTRLALHFTPFQSQKLLPNHPDGVKLSTFASFDMNFIYHLV